MATPEDVLSGNGPIRAEGDGGVPEDAIGVEVSGADVTRR